LKQVVRTLFSEYSKGITSAVHLALFIPSRRV